MSLKTIIRKVFSFYIYSREIKEAKQTGNWNAVLAGLTIFGVDFFNET